MNNIKLILSTIIFMSIMLTGCSSNTQIDQPTTTNTTTHDVKNVSVSDKFNKINNDINTIRSEMQNIKEEAARANRRLDVNQPDNLNTTSTTITDNINDKK